MCLVRCHAIWGMLSKKKPKRKRTRKQAYSMCNYTSYSYWDIVLVTIATTNPSILYYYLVHFRKIPMCLSFTVSLCLPKPIIHLSSWQKTQSILPSTHSQTRTQTSNYNEIYNPDKSVTFNRHLRRQKG